MQVSKVVLVVESQEKQAAQHADTLKAAGYTAQALAGTLASQWPSDEGGIILLFSHFSRETCRFLYPPLPAKAPSEILHIILPIHAQRQWNEAVYDQVYIRSQAD